MASSLKTMMHARSLVALLLLALVAPTLSAPAPELAERAPQNQYTLALSRGRTPLKPTSSSSSALKPVRTVTSSSTRWVTTSTTKTVATTTTTKQVLLSSVRGVTTTTTLTRTTPTTKTTSKAATTSKATPTSKPVSTTKTTSKASPTTSKPPASTYRPKNAVYYPDWTGSQIPPETVDYSLFDIIYFSFAIPAPDMTLYWTQWNSADLLRRTVKAGHAGGSKVCITIGGWTGSQHFSDAVKNAQNREIFASNIAAMVNEYGADGVDLDWEYPGQNGAPGNIIAAADSANLLTFLALLRSKFGSDKIISLATPTNVWLGPDGQPLRDVSAYAKYIDHVLIMNYDVWGSSANPGPNAPYSTCSGSWQPGANAVAAVAAWKAAGMPATKIMLGLPAYGYVSDSTATTLIHRRSHQMEAMQARRIAAEARANMHDGNLRPRLEASQETKRDLVSRADAGDISSFKNTQIQFNQLVSYKVLSLSTTGVWYGKNGYTRKWDECSSTPYVYNQARSTVVTYDDPTSLRIKAQFARDQGLAGTGMWDISGDTKDWALVKATREGLGL